MWDLLADLIFFSLPPKVQLGCLAIAVVMIGLVIVWAVYA